MHYCIKCSLVERQRRWLMHDFLKKLWYQRSILSFILIPLSLVFRLIVSIRRFLLEAFFQTHFDVPVIVVGNITVGGVGKTPLVIALAKELSDKGFKPGIVSRGYKAKISTFPHRVDVKDLASEVGDEPLMMARNSKVPVVISPNRVSAVNELIESNCDVIISDDGLQHYKMGRLIEIAVVDQMSKLGNGWCLPAGPLREPKKRLKQVDYVIVNGSAETGSDMTMIPEKCIHLKSGKAVSLDEIIKPIHAVAGIGNPERFFATLKSLGLLIDEHSFADHHRFLSDELNFKNGSIIMTEKDAVKCQDFDNNSIYYLKVKAAIDDRFIQSLVQRLSEGEVNATV